MRRGFGGTAGRVPTLVATMMACGILTAGALLAQPPQGEAKDVKEAPQVAPAAPAGGPGGYAGSSDCKGCHSKQFKGILDTGHRVLLTDKSLKPEHTGCEGCHGPSQAHVAGDQTTVPVGRNFRKAQPAEVVKACLACHRDEKLAAFDSNGHGRDGKTTCLACHSVHGAKADRLLRVAQPDACYKCHPGTRAQMNMPSHHPIREGKMKCTGCHNPHGSPSGTRGMLARENVNETCLKCHSNLAGPWTFEHAPAAKSCLICHRPHGSVNQQLLAQPEVTLCVKCHNPEHSGFAARKDTVKSLQRQLAYQSCSHCHPRIHGSDQDHGFTN